MPSGLCRLPVAPVEGSKEQHVAVKCTCYPSTSIPGGSAVKNLPAMQETEETRVQSLGWKDPLEEGMESYSSILAWRIPWTEEPGDLQSIES